MAIHVKLRKKPAKRLFARVKRSAANVGGAEAVKLEAQPKKILYTRAEQSDGGFLMNYYYVRGSDGSLCPEDMRSATNYERVYYDRDGNVLASMIGELGDKVKW